jgi:hypothetical protein
VYYKYFRGGAERDASTRLIALDDREHECFGGEARDPTIIETSGGGRR